LNLHHHCCENLKYHRSSARKTAKKIKGISEEIAVPRHNLRQLKGYITSAYFVFMLVTILNLTYSKEMCQILNIRKRKIHKTIKVVVFWNVMTHILMTFSEVLEKPDVSIFIVKA
jgi:hypothetical protein